MSERSARHATFRLERTFAAPPARVFQAFADVSAKARWFAGPPDWDKGPGEFDFRVGGRETSVGGPKGGPIHRFEARYHDIVPNERIVYAYEMSLDDTRISVSLTTIELEAAGGGTHMTFTEQGVFLDAHDDAGSREQGTGWSWTSSAPPCASRRRRDERNGAVVGWVERSFARPNNGLSSSVGSRKELDPTYHSALASNACP